MQRFFLVLTIQLLSISACLSQNRRMGLNLADLSNFSSQIVYVDVMNQSSRWLVQPVDESVFSIEGAAVPEGGPNGYPVEVPFEIDGEMMQPHVAVLNDQPEPFLYPAGVYTLQFEGQGEVVVRWDVRNGPLTFDQPNVEHTFQVDPTTLGLNVAIIRSEASDPIRNIRLILPGFADTYETQPFHPDFLNLLEPFEAIRFMKPLAVEENTLSEWEDRTRVDNYTYVTDDTEQVRFGMPYEHVALLANTLQKDIWINVPPFANTKFIEEMASLFAAQLDNYINLYIEYSNETWNTLYPLTRQFMIDQGRAMGLSDDDLEANVRYHALRSFQIWDEFKEAFGSRSGQIREVLGSQSFVGVGRISIDAIKDTRINPNGTIPYAIAVASYMGIELVDELIDEFGECGFNAELILNRLEALLPVEMAEYMEQFQFWSDSTGIEVMAYEGGQHLGVGSFGLNSECIAEAVAEANRSSRMNQLFCDYFDLWYDEYDGGLFMSFLLAESYGPGGSFGILESTLQNPSTSQKFLAHETCAFAFNPTLDIEGDLSFDATPIGMSSQSSITVQNNGGSALIINQIIIPEGFSSDFSGGSIPINNSQVINITFSPEQARAYEGEIVILSNTGFQIIEVTAQGEQVTAIDHPYHPTFSIYPNPAAQRVQLDLSQFNGLVHYNFINPSGKIVKSNSLWADENTIIEVGDLKSGLYFVTLNNNRQRAVRKILIRR